MLFGSRCVKWLSVFNAVVKKNFVNHISRVVYQ